MDITPPYGYQEIVPLNKEHRVVLPRIYAHLMSMSNFNRLLTRRASQRKTGAKV